MSMATRIAALERRTRPDDGSRTPRHMIRYTSLQCHFAIPHVRLLS